MKISEKAFEFVNESMGIAFEFKNDKVLVTEILRTLAGLVFEDHENNKDIKLDKSIPERKGKYWDLIKQLEQIVDCGDYLSGSIKRIFVEILHPLLKRLNEESE